MLCVVVPLLGDNVIELVGSLIISLLDAAPNDTNIKKYKVFYFLAQGTHKRNSI